MIGLTAALSGCISPKRDSDVINYYSLEYAPPAVSESRGIPVVIRLGKFQVAPVFDTNKMIYREADYKRNAYTYHKWWAKPDDLAAQFLSRDLKAGGLFKAVLLFNRGLPATHAVEGTVSEFFEEDTGNDRQAVLTMDITLIAENEPDAGRGIIMQKTYKKTETYQEKNPRALAEAMSRAMADVSARIITDIYQALKR